MRSLHLMCMVLLVCVVAACGGRSDLRSASLPQGELRYVVQTGDTLAELASRSGLSTGTIAERNNLYGPLLAGQVLYLPGVSALAAKVPAAPASTLSTSYRLLPRAAWGARPLRANYDPMGAIRRVTVHHTSEIPGLATRSEVELVRAVQVAHQDSNGWADLGYHFLIGRDGTVFEGRPLTAQGAHCGGENNRHNIGIALIGDFHHALPNEVQLAALRAVLADVTARYGIPATAVQPHRHYGNTICPGDRLADWLLAWRAGASNSTSALAHTH